MTEKPRAARTTKASWLFHTRASVAQIFNLPYRRFAIGRPSKNRGAHGLSDGRQNTILRYGRLKICATPEVSG